MSKKLQAIILALGLSVVVFGIGCSKDDDDEPQGPTIQERLVGSWDATNPEAIVNDAAGRVEFDFTSSNTFSLKLVFPSSPLDDDSVIYTGDYEAEGDGHLHLTDIEIDGAPSEDTFEWAFTLYADDDSLDVNHDEITETTVEVHYINVTQPAN